jgi:hypothetical protein
VWAALPPVLGAVDAWRLLVGAAKGRCPWRVARVKACSPPSGVSPACGRCASCSPGDPPPRPAPLRPACPVSATANRPSTARAAHDPAFPLPFCCRCALARLRLCPRHRPHRRGPFARGAPLGHRWARRRRPRSRQQPTLPCPARSRPRHPARGCLPHRLQRSSGPPGWARCRSAARAARREPRRKQRSAGSRIALRGRHARVRRDRRSSRATRHPQEATPATGQTSPARCSRSNSARVRSTSRPPSLMR